MAAAISMPLHCSLSRRTSLVVNERHSVRKPAVIVLAVALALLIALLCFSGTAEAAFSFSSGIIGISSQQSTATTQQTLTSEKKVDIATVTSEGSSSQLAEPTAHVAGSGGDDAEALSILSSAYESDDRATSIDAYLSGTALEGYGSTFVAAAEAYGLDARLLPAISMVESTGGSNCFLSHNAWGYGRYSWSSWEEAIWGVAAGISSGYGSDATPESMEGVYCAAPWGSKVRSCMSQIY